VDDELLAYAKRTIALEHGLSERDASRLVGETAAEIHADARAMGRELGVTDPTERARDQGGRYTTSGERPDLNRLIRQAAGR
jgi:hypothetical protein